MTEGIYFVEIPTALQRTSGRKQTTAGDWPNDLIINFVRGISFFSIYTTSFSDRINCQDVQLFLEQLMRLHRYSWQGSRSRLGP